MTNEKKTLLLIEDEEPMLNALAKKFQSADFEVLKASDGEEGLEMALAKKPDIVILDIIMPKIDGMTVMKRIREDKRWGAYVPIIMLTNLNDPESMSEASKFKVHDFLVKTDWRLDDIVKLAKDKLDLQS